jgi:hypothetical protein
MERFANNPASTLAGGINDAVTTLTVADASSFPTAGTFRLLVGDELMLVTGVSGSTFTVVRGSEGSTATSHSSGVNLTAVLTSGAIAQYKSDIVQSGLYSARPAAGNAGTLYLSETSLARDNGTTWDSYGPFNKFTPPGSYSGWGWGRQGSGVTIDTPSTGVFTMTQMTAESSVIRTSSYTRTPFSTSDITVETCLSLIGNATSIYSGLSIRDSSGRNYFFGPSVVSSSFGITLGTQTSETASVTSLYSLNLALLTSQIWLRLRHNSNTITGSVSIDGESFTEVHSSATTGFTPATTGVMTGAYHVTSGILGVSITVPHWREF